MGKKKGTLAFKAATNKHGTRTSGDDDDDRARREALHTPPILREIFSHLDTKNLKNIRHVCKAWDAEGSIILGKRCQLPLHRLFNDYDPTEEPVSVNPKLLESISIHPPGNVVEYKEGHQDNKPRLCFAAFASIWHSIVQEIDVKMDTAMAVGVPSILNAHAFPNLTKMTIHKMFGSDPKVYLPFASINTLKELKIIGNGFDQSCHCGHPLLQNLINTAINLEVLDMVGNFYPNLASCGKLKVLKWFGFMPGLSQGQTGFKHHEVLRMLNQVAERLEHLSLGQIGFLHNASCIRRFPNLPKLTSLTIESVDVLRMVDQICPSILPSLEAVAFRGQHVLNTSKSDQGSNLTHEGVKSLELLGVNRLGEITLASKKFPTVNRLVMGILEPKEEVHVNKAKYLCTILKACSTWKLRYLELQIGKGFKLSQLLGGLKSLILLKGINQVRIVAEKYLLDDDLAYDFQAFVEVVQLSAKMDRMIFKGLPVKATTKEKVMKFLHEHKELPVFYLD